MFDYFNIRNYGKYKKVQKDELFPLDLPYTIFVLSWKTNLMHPYINASDIFRSVTSTTHLKFCPESGKNFQTLPALDGKSIYGHRHNIRDSSDQLIKISRGWSEVIFINQNPF